LRSVLLRFVTGVAYLQMTATLPATGPMAVCLPPMMRGHALRRPDGAAAHAGFRQVIPRSVSEAEKKELAGSL